MKNFFTLIFLSLTFISCENERLISLKGLIYGTTYNIQFYNNSNENLVFKHDYFSLSDYLKILSIIIPCINKSSNLSIYGLDGDPWW